MTDETTKNEEIIDETVNDETDGTIAVSTTLRDAFASKSNANQFLANPAAAFQRNGFDIPGGQEKEFNDYFNEVSGDFVTRLRETPENRLSVVHEELLEERGFGCKVCKISVWAAAVALGGLTAAALPGLTVTSTVVIRVAALLRWTRPVALRFIKGLGGAIKKGVNAIAERICEEMKRC